MHVSIIHSFIPPNLRFSKLIHSPRMMFTDMSTERMSCFEPTTTVLALELHLVNWFRQFWPDDNYIPYLEKFVFDEANFLRCQALVNICSSSKFCFRLTS